ncbi:DNA repair exonuclease SbcCD nuclease subunit [Acetitomaculum ruminis DSM 5522]|uniref:DNA repair exonuclease SbcCD nuclease subunit n=1 Tax=Acetitomaculum ruminis DSM 5522 TaxID=1120918 RepID=A0A1I0W539_9FIRM|nr:metallophosphoesterase [Acetitomaculum ruminis]SFA83438.1 DNA repair exonuclease SbcCD nuclease subunit [Acetitomaculum ruminis DSM 5522]
MKIIHCSDLHLDSRMETNLSREQAVERKKEFFLAFEKMIFYAKVNEVKVIIIAGDFFDNSHAGLSLKKKVLSLIVDNPDIDFLYLKGRHDSKNVFDDLEIEISNLKFFSEEWTKYSYLEENLIISGIEVSKENNMSLYDSLILDKDKVNIVVMHGPEANTYSSDTEDFINIRELQNKYIDYLALGYLHDFKLEKLDNRGVFCYSGSLSGRGFDECGLKGFVVVDINNGNVEVEFAPIRQRDFYKVEVDISGLLTAKEILERIKDATKNIDSKDLVRVSLVGDVSMDCDMDLGYFYRQCKDDFYFIKIVDRTKLAIDYEDYKYDASLKGEFIRTILELDMDNEEKDKIIITGIKALSGEDIEL